MLEERNHRGRDRDHLARRDVHVVDVRGRNQLDLATLTSHGDPGVGEEVIGVDRRVRLSNDVTIFFVGGEVLDLFGDLTVDDLAVRRLDEAERVDPCVHRQRTDQADVRTFRSLDRAHTAVVAVVHVADLEAGTLTGQTAGAQRRKTALVGKTRQRVVLVHELRQLRSSEELLDRGNDRADVDQGLRRDRLDVLSRHPLAHHALHAGQAHADLVLNQLADRTQTTVTEVVDVVDLHRNLDAAGSGHDLVARMQVH